MATWPAGGLLAEAIIIFLTFSDYLSPVDWSERGSQGYVSLLKPSMRASLSYKLPIWSFISIIGTTEQRARVFHAHPHSTLNIWAAIQVPTRLQLLFLHLHSDE